MLGSVRNIYLLCGHTQELVRLRPFLHMILADSLYRSLSSSSVISVSLGVMAMLMFHRSNVRTPIANSAHTTRKTAARPVALQRVGNSTCSYTFLRLPKTLKPFLQLLRSFHVYLCFCPYSSRQFPEQYGT